MSEIPPSRDLSSGNYFVHILKNRKLGDFILVEARYGPKLQIPFHSHEHTTFSVVLHGSHEEHYVRKTIRCDTLSFLVRPATEPHSNHFEERETRILTIEITDRFLGRLRKHGVHIDEPRCFNGEAFKI